MDEPGTAVGLRMGRSGSVRPPIVPALIVPSLYAADHAALADAVAVCAAAGTRRFHVDLMDGRFVPSLGLSLRALESLARRHPDLAFDVHLMVEDPARLALEAAAAGAASVTIHVEAIRAPTPVIERLRQCGVAVGLALSPATPPEAVAGLVDEADLVLVMLVEPGQTGQALRPALLDKVAALRRAHPHALVVADGGIDLRHVGEVAHAGADHLVCGQAVFSGPPADTLSALGAALSA
jgi:ribulose-phosphate 3-epimerase